MTNLTGLYFVLDTTSEEMSFYRIHKLRVQPLVSVQPGNPSWSSRAMSFDDANAIRTYRRPAGSVGEMARYPGELSPDDAAAVLARIDPDLSAECHVVARVCD